MCGAALLCRMCVVLCGAMWRDTDSPPPTFLSTHRSTASKIEGPYDWTSSPNISSSAINPAALVFPNATTGKTAYSLWIGGDILVASDAAGPAGA